MNDREFLIWLHERMEHQHKEHPLVDFMHKLRAIIAGTDPDVRTFPCGGCNSLKELKEKLKV